MNISTRRHGRCVHGDMLVHVALQHVLLVCVALAVYVVHSMLFGVTLGGGYQWNLSWTALVLFSVHHVAAYFGALQEDLLVGLA
ncbi:hypothetical protein EV1_018419 [Malus domestica]